MNYSSQPTITLNDSEALNTIHLQNAVAYTEKRLRKSFFRLKQVKQEPLNRLVRRQANLFLLENNNLLEIAKKLLAKMYNSEISEAEDLNDLALELDLLDTMHYQLAKVCSPFIDRYFELPIIRMNRIVAA